MSSYNKNQNDSDQKKNTLYWIGVIVCFCIGLWPISLLMLILKGVAGYDSRKTANSRSKWAGAARDFQQDVREFADDLRDGAESIRSDFEEAARTERGSGYTSTRYTQNSTYHYTYQNGHRIDPEHQEWVHRQQREQQAALREQGRSQEDPWEEQQRRQAQQQESARRNAAFQQEQTEKRKRLQLFKKHSDTGKWSAMFTGGAVLGGLGIIGTVSSVIENLWELTGGNIRWFLEDTYGGLVIVGIGAVLCYIASRKKKIARRNREYFSVIGEDNYVSLTRLSAVTGTDVETMCDDLSRLLDQGVFGSEAHLDMSRQALILNRKGEQELNLREAQQRAARPKQTTPEDDLLHQIREVNDRIPDEKLSRQIYRIEEITGQILQCQKDHPEKEAQLHSFLSYYLPTTLKILNAYAEMEKQAVQGKNITETKSRIEDMMEKVVAGFEEQLDQLYAGDRMDITSEISALETMMAQDGLTDEDPFGDVMGQTMGGV